MKEIKQASVIGAGTMGHAIAYLLAEVGIKVCLIDANSQNIKTALENIENILESGVIKSKILIEDAHAIRSQIITSPDLESMIGSDFVIEAVPEDLKLKQHIFSVADALIDDDGILATNTSSLPLHKIKANIVQRDRFLGLHFFNPPHVMKLLEIIVHDEVSIETINMVKNLALRLRKECIVVNDSPGFATSRLGMALALEAIRMLESNVAGVLDIDTAMKLGYGHPMGPLMLSDWVGLDVRLAISENLYRALDLAVFAPPDILRRMVRAGFLGKKSGTGFYEWEGARHLGVSQTMLDLLKRL